MSFDRLVNGIATATAPAALAADATTALEAAFRCGLAQIPPPRTFKHPIALLVAGLLLAAPPVAAQSPSNNANLSFPAPRAHG